MSRTALLRAFSNMVSARVLHRCHHPAMMPPTATQRFWFCQSNAVEHDVLPLYLLATYIDSETKDTIGTYDDILSRLRTLACETLEYANDGSITLVSWSDAIDLIEDIGACTSNLKVFVANHAFAENSVAQPTKDAGSTAPSLGFPKSHRRFHVGDASRVDEPVVNVDALELAVKSGDIAKVQRELEQTKYGFAFLRLEGKNMLMASNGQRFPLHSKAKKWNQVHDGKALLCFVKANADPGKVRCPRCHKWFNSYVEQRFDYAPCLGYCATAMRVGN